jgi:hypothetical protein
MLYDSFCGADPSRVTFNVRITAISADAETITVDELDSLTDHLGSDSTFYVAGFIRREGRHYFITGQAGHVLTLQTPMTGAAVDDWFPATAGCNRQTSDCTAVHDNIERFGGFPLIPVVSPWAGLT